MSPAARSFSYDAGGRRISSTLGNGVGTTWTFGRQDNLVTEISATNVTTLDYAYDANKNKTKETISAPMANYGFGTNTAPTYVLVQGLLTAGMTE